VLKNRNIIKLMFQIAYCIIKLNNSK